MLPRDSALACLTVKTLTPEILNPENPKRFCQSVGFKGRSWLWQCSKRRWVAAAADAIDPRRVALTVTHFPEWRTLEADEADPDDSAIHSGGGQEHAYDPAYLLPFSLLVGLLPPHILQRQLLLIAMHHHFFPI